MGYASILLAILHPPPPRRCMCCMYNIAHFYLPRLNLPLWEQEYTKCNGIHYIWNAMCMQHYAN